MNFGLWLAAVLQMPVTRVPSWGSPAEAQLSPCRAGALGGVHLQGVAQMLFLPHPWEATEEARAKFFAHGCLGVGQPSVLSLHSSLSLLSSTEPHVHCSCGKVQRTPARSHFFFLLECSAGEVTPWLSSLSGSQPQTRQDSQGDSSCCFSEQPFLYSLKTLQEPG